MSPAGWSGRDGIPPGRPSPAQSVMPRLCTSSSGTARPCRAWSGSLRQANASVRAARRCWTRPAAPRGAARNGRARQADAKLRAAAKVARQAAGSSPRRKLRVRCGNVSHRSVRARAAHARRDRWCPVRARRNIRGHKAPHPQPGDPQHLHRNLGGVGVGGNEDGVGTSGGTRQILAIAAEGVMSARR